LFRYRLTYMLATLRRFLSGQAPAAVNAKDDLQVAVAALLIEAAKMDAMFDGIERAAIKRILADRFDLSGEATEALIAAATEVADSSVQIFGFTRHIARLEYEDRVSIIEMLWDVALADGELSAHEDSLIRRVAGLIYVSDADRGAARRRVLAAKA
jgi:uncharacterized tellurite resistance protein B-like protein